MPRVTCASDHRSIDELDQRIKQASHHWHRLAGQVILAVLENPRPATLIACQLHVSQTFVYKVIARYNQDGPDASSHHRPLHHAIGISPAPKERQFLEPFFDRVQRGDISSMPSARTSPTPSPTVVSSPIRVGTSSTTCSNRI